MAQMNISNTLWNDTKEGMLAYVKQLKDDTIKNYIDNLNETDKGRVPSVLKEATGVFQNTLNNFFLQGWLDFQRFLNDEGVDPDIIDSWKEVQDFLDGLPDDETTWLKNKLDDLNDKIDAMDISDGGAYDVSAANVSGGQYAKYASIANAISAIPYQVQDPDTHEYKTIWKPGMVIRYINSYTNKYEHWRYLLDDVDTPYTFTDFHNWVRVEGTNDIFDVSALTGDSYETLSAALTAAGTYLDSNPNDKKGGMSIKFIQLITPASYTVVRTANLTEEPTGTLLTEVPQVNSGTYTASELTAFLVLPSDIDSSHAVTYYTGRSEGSSTIWTSWVITKISADVRKYVQYRLMTTYWSTVVSDWQGVDEYPIQNSNNLVKSGSVYDIKNSTVSFSEAQTLTDAQKAQALANVGISGIDETPTVDSQNLVKSGGVKEELALGAVYDVSAHNSGTTFASLSALLSDANINTLIPSAVRKGGMSIKFVQSSDNKYVQYRYMGTAVTGTPNPFLDTANWQGVDDEPTAGSDNLVKSGGIKSYLDNTQVYRFTSLIFNQAVLTTAGIYATTTLAGYYATAGYYNISQNTKKLFVFIPAINSPYATVCFYNSNKEFISSFYTADRSQIAEEYILDVPENAAFVRFGYYTLIQEEISKVYAGVIYDLKKFDEDVSVLQKEVSVIESKTDAVFNNKDIVVYQAEQDFVGAVKGSKYQGQAVFIENVSGKEFDKIRLPFFADSENQELTLVIGQTDSAIGRSAVRNAFESSNILFTKTTKLNITLGYTDINLGRNVVITKKHCVIGVYSEVGSHVYCAYYSDNTDKGAYTFLMLSDNWYEYGGNASYIGYGPLPYLEIANKTKEAIDEVRSQSGGNMVDIVLPDKITAVVGDELQIYYRSIIKTFNPYERNILLSCLKGVQLPRFFQYTPATGDVGNINFHVKVRGSDFISTLASKGCTLKVVNVVGSPSANKNIVCIGDSLSSAGKWVEELSRRLTGTGGTPSGKGLTNLTFCGAMGNENAKYYGVGGWTWASYATAGVTAYRFYVSGVTFISLNSTYTNNGTTWRVIEVNLTGGTGNILCQKYSGSNNPQASGTLTRTGGTGDDEIIFSSSEQAPGNPFWDANNNKISFSHYANTYCNGNIDAIYALLGANSLSPNKTDFTSIIANIKDFADELHLEFPNAKLKIMGCAGISHNGGMSEYGATGSGYADEYGIFLAMLNLNEAYQEFANQDGYSDFVEFVDVMSQLDSEYNFPRSQFDVNTRNSTKEYRDTNGVHPSTEGQYQIADVVYRNIVAEYCQ